MLPAGLLLLGPTSYKRNEKSVYLLLSEKGYTRPKSLVFVKLPIWNKNLQFKRITTSVVVERISIPRGHAHFADSNSLTTAIREFVEETKLVPKAMYVYDETFTLTWTDDDREYSYIIYIGCISTNDMLKEAYPCSEYINSAIKTTKNGLEIEFTPYRGKNYEERRKLVIIAMNDYIHYMNKYQVGLYTKSNYIEFLQFIKNVIFVSRKKWSKISININTLDPSFR